MISVQNITKQFGETMALRGVSFEVQKGEVLGFLGPNGAGKSTTMRIITCYMPANSGSVSVDGFDVYKNSLEVRRRLGYLPENAPLYLDMKVIEFLGYIADIRQVSKTERTDRIGKMVEVCGLEGVCHKNIAHLSRGYRQRVGLAQSMLHDPDILILDEPTLGLDPNQIIEIRELIKRLGREKTVILCSHILPEVSATCSRIIIINDGRIVASGAPEELTSKAGGAPVLYITVRGPADEVAARLARVEGITGVRAEGEPEAGLQRFTVTGQEGARPGEDLFRAVVEGGWSISELRQESATLEDVFTKLTTGEKA
jgi:ABC-2 type transport system ATP-binding protein